jgi:hypothetical protein
MSDISTATKVLFPVSLLHPVLFFFYVTKRHDIPAPLLKVAHYFHTVSPRLGEKYLVVFIPTILPQRETSSIFFFLLEEDERYFLLYLLSNSEYQYTFFFNKTKRQL